MIDDFKGKTAVLTGAGSGFGLECARIGARLGMNLVLVDVQQDALDRAETEMKSAGAAVLAHRVDVAKANEMEALAQAVAQRFGAPHLVFNNAGVGAGGLVWENTIADWEWVLGVNLWGVIHGVRAFAPYLIALNEGHIVNTASVAGLISPPGSGAYNVTKHAVVALSETLYHDLRERNSAVGVSVLCPAYVPTGIVDSERSRPGKYQNPPEEPSPELLARQAMLRKAVTSGRISADEVAQAVVAAIQEERFYILTHPRIAGAIRSRMQDILQGRAPKNPLGLGRPRR
jgi:NAD(P)-dependent dehydrogenase (short-subunit alcohol dehydrogenase family)